MNVALQRVGQAGLWSMLGYELGQSTGQKEVRIERVEPKVIEHTDHGDYKEMFYVMIGLLVLFIFIFLIAALRIVLGKKVEREQIRLREL